MRLDNLRPWHGVESNGLVDLRARVASILVFYQGYWGKTGKCEDNGDQGE